jgi:hypothetical protein
VIPTSSSTSNIFTDFKGWFNDTAHYLFIVTKGWKKDDYLRFFHHLIPALIDQDIVGDQKFKISPPDKKEQVHVLCDYLVGNECTCIIVEKSYVDRTYLDDFVEYHLTAFPHYKKTCSRLHFFGCSGSECLDEAQFKTRFILNLDPGYEKSFKDSYLGFTIIKPLPNIFIGRSCLAPPNASDKFLTNTYKCNLFGHYLEIKSLVFQEQDPTVGACASISLWSAFHACAEIFNNVMTPTPSKITRIAATKFPTYNRIFPSCGMDPSQMIGVIKHVGLEAEYWEIFHESYKQDLKSLVYAYSHLPTPAILLLYLRSRDGQGINSLHAPDHTVVVSGYKLDPNYKDTNDFRKRGDSITSLYIHDDNGGPYLECPVVLEKQSVKEVIYDEPSKIVKFINKEMDVYCLKIRRHTFGAAGDGGWEIGEIRGVVFPVQDKIRINYDVVLKVIVRLRWIIETFLRVGADKPCWDIHLSSVSDFKADLLQQPLMPQVKNEVITSNYPRFLWRCICIHQDKRVVEFLFDATDLSTSVHVSECFFYSSYNLSQFLVFIKTQEAGVKRALNSDEHFQRIKGLIERWLALVS